MYNIDVRKKQLLTNTKKKILPITKQFLGKLWKHTYYYLRDSSKTHSSEVTTPYKTRHISTHTRTGTNTRRQTQIHTYAHRKKYKYI